MLAYFHQNRVGMDFILHSFVVCHSLFTGRLIDSLIQHEEMKDIFSQKTELKNWTILLDK